jgi:hypothetical protein
MKMTLLFEYEHADADVNYTDGTQHPDGHIRLVDGRFTRPLGRRHAASSTSSTSHEDTWLDRAGNFHSEELHLVERYSRPRSPITSTTK